MRVLSPRRFAQEGRRQTRAERLREESLRARQACDGRKL